MATIAESISTFKDPDNYPALALWQPFAGLIWLAGAGYRGKELELRTKRITYRGPVVISAAKRVEPIAFAAARHKLVGAGLVPAHVFDKMCGKEVAGQALALFDVIGCRPMTEADHDLAFTDYDPGAFPVEGRYVWEGGNIAALNPFPVRGMQGFGRVSKVQTNAVVHFATTKEERRKRAKRPVVDTTPRCLCGSPFPKHLAEFMNDDPRSTHVCRCEREYAVRDGKFVQVGTKSNPFAPREAAHGA